MTDAKNTKTETYCERDDSGHRMTKQRIEYIAQERKAQQDHEYTFIFIGGIRGETVTPDTWEYVYAQWFDHTEIAIYKKKKTDITEHDERTYIRHYGEPTREFVGIFREMIATDYMDEVPPFPW